VARLALDVPHELTVLVSPYSSVRAMATEHYPWVPSALLRYPLATDELLPRLSMPALLLHGERDSVIPLSHSQALQRVDPRTRLHIVKGADHNDLEAFDDYHRVLRSALDAL
jgi:hypothetical protein